MPIKLPVPIILLLNVIGWPIIQIGISWLVLRLPAAWFNQTVRILRPARWETVEGFYEAHLAVRRWKDWLPDGGSWFRGGFTKGNIACSDLTYLKRFLTEINRGEVAHWLMMLCGPIFILWNPPWAVAVMLVYAVFANLPCIVVQRYNRVRLHRVIAKRMKAEAVVPTKLGTPPPG